MTNKHNTLSFNNTLKITQIALYMLIILSTSHNLFATNKPLISIPGSTAYSYNDTLIFNDDFRDKEQTKKTWNIKDTYFFSEKNGDKGLLFENQPNQSKLITTEINCERIKGRMILLSALIKAENISEKKHPWNGIKVMFKIELDNGTYIYPQLPILTSSPNWDEECGYIKIQKNAKKVYLNIGLENCSGKVWFKNVKIISKEYWANIPPPVNKKKAISKLHNNIPTLRGVLVQETMQAEDFKTLHNWNVNVIRWTLNGCVNKRVIHTNLSSDNFQTILESSMDNLDTAILYCKKYNINIVVDMHVLSGNLFKSTEAPKKLIEAWKYIAHKYKNEKTVWAYDIANEPNLRNVKCADGIMFWEDLATEITKQIREIDKEKAIMIEAPDANPDEFKEFKPIDLSYKNIIYSVHMYAPLKFTHQTILYKDTCVYPGNIDGVYWNKDKLKEALKPVKDFQDKYQVPIFVGEFSAVRSASKGSAYNYLKDCIEIFESYKWDWCYHAFRESPLWSVELSENRNDAGISKKPNKRQLLLRTYFKQNVKKNLKQKK